MFQPLAVKRLYSCDKLSESVSTPVWVYSIIIIGITISLAGKPRINAVSITPSIPNSWANGSKKSVR